MEWIYIGIPVASWYVDSFVKSKEGMWIIDLLGVLVLVYSFGIRCISDVFLGIVISPIILFICGAIQYKSLKSFWKTIIFEKKDVLIAIEEEFIWRDIIVLIVNNGLLESRIGLTVLAIQDIIFLKKHAWKQGRPSLEAVLYSIVLSIGAWFMPGINWGLHIGRNNYINGCN